MEILSLAEELRFATTYRLYVRSRNTWRILMNWNEIKGLFGSQENMFRKMFSWFYGVWKLENIFQRENILLDTGTDISRLISLVSRSKAFLALEGHMDARQFMTRLVPFYKYLCLICNSYPAESDCFSLQCTEPENEVQEVKPGQATKCSQSPVTSVSSEDEIGAVLEPAHLDSNTTGSNLKCKCQPENRLNSAHTRKSQGEDDGMASALREMASVVSYLTEKKDDRNTNSIPIENVITAV